MHENRPFFIYVSIAVVLFLSRFAFAESSNNSFDYKRQLQLQDEALQRGRSQRNELQTKRDQLLGAINKGNAELVQSLIEDLSSPSLDGYGLDEYEIIQIYFLTKQYEKAIHQFFKVTSIHRRIHYSFTDSDSLGEKLKSQTNIADPATLQQVLNKASQSVSGEDYKHALKILTTYFKTFKVNSRPEIPTIFGRESLKPSQDSLYARCIYQNFGIHNNIKKEIQYKTSLDSFMVLFPNSKLIPVISKEQESHEKYIQDYHKQKEDAKNEPVVLFAPVPDNKLYTGGIGAEFFVSLTGGYLITIPIQIKRFIITAGYQSDSYNKAKSGSTKEEIYNAFATVGFDIFETPRFKIQPFIGAGTLFLGGAQVEFRIFHSRPHVDTGIAIFSSLKLRYAAEFIDGYEPHHNIGIGIGAHFW